MLWNIDPWHELERMRTELDDMFAGGGRAGVRRSFPLVNIYDDMDNLVVNAELPGMSKEDVTITFTDGTLTLSGKRPALVEDDKAVLIRTERATGAFEKSFQIPYKVDQDKIAAGFSNGMLTVTLPKAEEAKPRSIQIEAR